MWEKEATGQFSPKCIKNDFESAIIGHIILFLVFL